MNEFRTKLKMEFVPYGHIKGFLTVTGALVGDALTNRNTRPSCSVIDAKLQHTHTSGEGTKAGLTSVPKTAFIRALKATLNCPPWACQSAKIILMIALETISNMIQAKPAFPTETTSLYSHIFSTVIA